MPYRTVASLAAITLTVTVGACNRQSNEPREAARSGTVQPIDRAAEQQRQHQDEVAGLDRRVADIERKYSEKESKVVTGRRVATGGLQEEVKEDVTNVRTAVNNLKTTTPENWWDRHEQAMMRTVDDIEADVRRLSGKAETARPQATSGTTAEGVSTAPFESRRDRLVADVRARADAMERALDDVKAKGARETEITDTKARVKKLREDADHLASAKADDWWDISKSRVTDYIDRVQASVDRLDDNRK
jgi:hypothetical protein